MRRTVVVLLFAAVYLVSTAASHAIQEINTQTAQAQLDAQLASILTRIQSLQYLDLAEETACRQALEESRRLLGAVAVYRHGLEAAALHRASSLRCAA